MAHGRAPGKRARGRPDRGLCRLIRVLPYEDALQLDFGSGLDALVVGCRSKRQSPEESRREEKYDEKGTLSAPTDFDYPTLVCAKY